MPKLIICRGLPASGKTTWAKGAVSRQLVTLEEFKDDPEIAATTKAVRVNRDDIRAMLHNSNFIKGVTEDVVIAVRDAAILAALRKGWDVISDDTNLKSRNVRDLLKIAAQVGAKVVFKDFTDVDVQTCINRDEERGRTGRMVGAEAIRDQYNRFIRGKTLPLPVPELDVPMFEPLPRGTIPAMIVDLDGTTAHNNGHRGFYQYERVKFDEPKREVIELVQNNIRMGMVALFVSGRNDVCREDTSEWIWKYVLSDLYPDEEGHALWREHSLKDNADQRGRHKLFMRLNGDMRGDAIIKYEIAQEFIAPSYDVKVAFDDRLRVCRMWNQIGWTVLRVGDPDADF